MLKTEVMFFIYAMAVHSAYCFSRMLHSCLSLCTKLHANKCLEILQTCARLKRPLYVRPNACSLSVDLPIGYFAFKMETSLDMENRFYNRFNEHLRLKNRTGFFHKSDSPKCNSLELQK